MYFRNEFRSLSIELDTTSAAYFTWKKCALVVQYYIQVCLVILVSQIWEKSLWLTVLMQSRLASQHHHIVLKSIFKRAMGRQVLFCSLALHSCLLWKVVERQLGPIKSLETLSDDASSKLKSLSPANKTCLVGLAKAPWIWSATWINTDFSIVLSLRSKARWGCWDHYLKKVGGMFRLHLAAILYFFDIFFVVAAFKR